jgi:hypothetical protein
VVELSDAGAKCLGVNRRITDELGLYQMKEFLLPVHLEQSMPQEEANVLQIAFVSSLQLGQSLAIRIVVEELDQPVNGNEQTAFTSAWKGRDKLIRIGQFDVEHSVISIYACCPQCPFAKSRECAKTYDAAHIM